MLRERHDEVIKYVMAALTAYGGAIFANGNYITMTQDPVITLTQQEGKQSMRVYCCLFKVRIVLYFICSIKKITFGLDSNKLLIIVVCCTQIMLCSSDGGNSIRF